MTKKKAGPHSGLDIRRVDISAVSPWDKNPRGIKTKDYERLKKQILRLGVYKPLVCYENGGGKFIVLGGNMRIRALKDLGLKEIEISVVHPTSEAQKIEFALSDNDRAGFYEEDKLAELVYPHIADLDLSDYKVDLGEALDLRQVVERFGPDIEDGADDVPEIDDSPAVTKLGDLFTLGKHRLLCGDSTKAEDVERLTGGVKPVLMVTDPPYGVEYDPMFRERVLGAADRRTGRVENDDQCSWAEAWKLAPCAVAYVWHADRFAIESGVELKSCGFEIRATIIWKKAHRPFGQGHYSFQHEPCWYAVRKGSAASWVGSLAQSTVWEVGLDKTADGGHGTQKPVEIMARPIRNHSGDVYDPFLGSGTTLIAAEKTGRVCYGMEIDPKYCDVIIKRYADYVGVDEKLIRKTVEHGHE